ncbi:nucleotide-binding protein [Enhygromyxa salina]|uniref:Nitrogenase iron protein 1 n=1 Tax=Enhygromyxa salina TaxID=215803 RepID=A0A2S9XNH6_9BACT|nr:ArsA-related P-loop ATPase [Enhygromyxa salina]PRP94280.1 Nitrogenase iron protein 1 [Enhygromyxa salina]
MERIVIFGKGGIGKSTVACGISASLAAAGKRVLHVGCDPKHDSTAALLRGKLIEPVVDRIEKVKGVTAEDIVVRSPLGVDCVEAGGPTAGVGCGGRGITRMLEIFNEAELLDESKYDLALYDVLGDVVCGGFAAPLRKGIGEKVVIVTSEELMALYAANNIARAVVHYANNGIALAGLIVNLKDPEADRKVVERFAERINTRILAWIPRDPLVREAEYNRTTVVEAYPQAPISRVLRELAERIHDESVADRPLPTPMNEEEFHVGARARFRADLEHEMMQTVAAEQAEAAAALAGPKIVEDGEVSVPLASLTRGDALAAAKAKREEQAARYAVELRAGSRAIRLGLIGAQEAVQRLRAAFPEHASKLGAEELTA